ncbi:MAG: methyltransferase [Chloroflexi bacterium]|nr:methyltransferase [Chloroflexota bacterium]
MLQLLNACLTAQALHVVATLGIADRLADGPAAIDDLATATGAHRMSLHRLLRTLVGAGVFREEGDGRFALTALGATLRSDGPDSVRDWALYVGAQEPWAAWGRLRETVLTGQSGFVLAHGMPTYQYLAQHPQLGAPFDRWMTRQSDQHNDAVVAAYDFSAFRSVADVGGGQGSTLAAILLANPSVQGILLDQPQVVAGAEPVLRAAGIAERCEVLDGDMLQGVPGGADAYLLKRVLMIWGDESAIRVLRHCAEALPTEGRVLVVEMVMPAGNDPSPARSFDLLMLLAHEAGRVRTEAAFRDLFGAAGLRLARIIPTASPNAILEGVRR